MMCNWCEHNRLIGSGLTIERVKSTKIEIIKVNLAEIKYYESKTTKVTNKLI